MKRNKAVLLYLSPKEKSDLIELAELKGASQSTTLRLLLASELQRVGLISPEANGQRSHVKQQSIAA